MLWLRDLCHLNRYDIERFDGNPPNVKLIQDRAAEGIGIWRTLCEVSARLAIDGLLYYSECVRTLAPDGSAIEAAISIGAARQGVGTLPGDGQAPPLVRGVFANQEDLRLLNDTLFKENTDPLSMRYF